MSLSGQSRPVNAKAMMIALTAGLLVLGMIGLLIGARNAQTESSEPRAATTWDAQLAERAPNAPVEPIGIDEAAGSEGAPEAADEREVSQGSGVTESSDASGPQQATESTETLDTAGAAEPDESAESTKTPEPDRSTEATEETKPSDADESTEESDSDDRDVTAEVKKPAEAVESKQPEQATAPARLTESTESVQPARQPLRTSFFRVRSRVENAFERSRTSDDRATDSRFAGVTRLTPKPNSKGVTNPTTGQYLWFPDSHPEGVLNGTGATDSYVRYTWRQLESTQGEYDFSQIDKELAKAKARGGKFSFRVMAVCEGCEGNSLPDDVNALPSTRSVDARGSSLRVPDWNDPAFLGRWEALMSALGDRYRDDPRLGMVDVGGYGNWGEGHNWPYEASYPGPRGQTEASVESMNRIAMAVVHAFPDKFVSINPPFMRVDGEFSADKSWQLLKQVLQSSDKVGLRNDCLGGGSVQESALDLMNQAQKQAVAEGVEVKNRPLDRWRIAPVVTEWCNNITPGESDGSFVQGSKQVTRLHVSRLSNGNFAGDISEHSPRERAAFARATEKAGYKLALDSAVVKAVPDTDHPGKVQVHATWVNKGVAPTYQPWQVTYVVRDSSGAVVAEHKSNLQLNQLLGGGSAQIDTVTLTAETKLKGKLSLHVLVEDPTGYYAPMRLAAGVRAQDGSYLLGNFKLR